MDRLTLTLFGLDRDQVLFEARGWDYVHEISLPFLTNHRAPIAEYCKLQLLEGPWAILKGQT